MVCFRRLVYGTHPLGRDPRGSLRNVRRLTRENVVAHHARHFAADRSFLVAVGDFETRTLARLVKAQLGSWGPAGEPARPGPRWARFPDRDCAAWPIPASRCISSWAISAFPGTIPTSRPWSCSTISSAAGLASPTGWAGSCRDELGLVYSIGGGITDSADLLPGLFRVYAGTMPEETSRVVAAIADQVRAMHDGAFSDDEVDRARRYLASAFLFDFQTVEQRADRLLELERLGLPLDEPRRWPGASADQSRPGAPGRAPTFAPTAFSAWNTDRSRNAAQAREWHRTDEVELSSADARRDAWRYNDLIAETEPRFGKAAHHAQPFSGN